MKSQPNLLEIVFTLASPSRFASLLHGGQQQRNQNRDDRDHDQQFDQRETPTGRTRHKPPHEKLEPKAAFRRSICDHRKGGKGICRVAGY